MSGAVTVVGGGGHAKVVVGAMLELGLAIGVVVDDDETKWGTQLLGVEISGPIASRVEAGEPAILAIGDNATRRRLDGQLGLDWLSVVHPAAWVDRSVDVGPGVFVAAGAIVQPGCRLGAHCIVNTLAGVDHDSHLGAWSHVAPGARLGGGVFVGDEALIGVGASVIPGARIGARTVVGVGAAVVGAIADDQVVMGVPARPRDHGAATGSAR